MKREELEKMFEMVPSEKYRPLTQKDIEELNKHHVDIPKPDSFDLIYGARQPYQLSD